MTRVVGEAQLAETVELLREAGLELGETWP